MTDLFQQNNTLNYFQQRGEEEKQNQLEVVNNLVSPEFIENEKKKGKVTAFETLSTAKKWGYAVPYIGTGAELGKNMRILNLQNKVKEGIQLSSDEMSEYKDFVLDMASQSVRGQTIPSMAWDGFLQSVPYMAEFGIGLATSESGVGLASLGSTGTKLAVKQTLKSGIKTALKESLKGATAKTLLKDSTIGVAKFNMKYLPQQGVKRWSEVELDENLLVTPEGQVLLNEAEHNPATSVLKAIGLMQIETLSETAGYAFNFAGRTLNKYISSKLLKHLPEKFVTNLEKLSRKVTGFSTTKALQKYGWNGILEEFGEERVSDLLQTSFDLDGQEGYSFEQFLTAMFPPKEQTLSELMSFALMSGMGTGIKKSVDFARYKNIAKDIQEKAKDSKGAYNPEKVKAILKENNPEISEENLEKATKTVIEGISKTEDYSVDDFLLDSGVFRLHARKSNTDERITQILQDNGVPQEEIDNILDYTSLDDKAQIIKLSQDIEYKKLTNEEKKRSQEIKNSIFNKLTDAGIKEKEASNLAITAGAFFERYATGNKESRKVFDNFMNNLSIKYNIPAKDRQFKVAEKKRQENKKQESLNYLKDVKEMIENNNLPSYEEGYNYSFARTFIEDAREMYDRYEKAQKELADKYDKKIKSLKTQKAKDKAINEYNESKKQLDKKLKNTKKMISEKIDGYSNEIANSDSVYFQSAYHGSPYKFDTFSTEHIGTGEGAQAHGWGLYFAENKDVSEGYRKSLSGDDFDNEKYFYNGKEITDRSKKAILATIVQYGKEEVIARREFYINNYAKNYGKDEVQKKKNELEYVKNIDENKIEKKTDKGQLFEVDIPENDVLLDEDKTFSKQSKKVQNAIIRLFKDNFEKEELLKFKAIPVGVYLNNKEIGENNFVEFALGIEIAKKYGKDIAIKQLNEEKKRQNDDTIPFDEYINFIKNVNLDDISIDERELDYWGDEATGEDIYGEIVNQIAMNGNGEISQANAEKQASLLLNSYGVKGITYNGQQDGRCYVIFDDNAINTIKTYYQEVENNDEEKLIAGYTYIEVMDKLTEIYDKISNMNEGEPNFDKYMAYTHILEDAFEMSMNPEKYNNQDKVNDTMLNVYYIMNGQEIPEKYVESDKTSQRTYNELKELHEKRKEENEQKYRGYFYKDAEGKPIVTIMQNRDSSTALHEFGHLYLDLLNELAKVNKDAESQLEAVNKWLGYSGEYTTAQHEKFANNFVAYLYKGQAPNAKLKTVFENFKQWLKSVYEHVLDIPDVDISPEVQELFDNIFGGDEFIEEKKQANELLKKVRKISAKQVLQEVRQVDDSKLDKTQKRHKDVAYEILSVATGKSTRYLKSIFETSSEKRGLGKKRENVQELLDKVDDKITVSGGMRSHWLEFYNDTGVSYENDETDGDYILAEQAFRDIINKSWGKNNFADYENALAERAEYFANEIDKSNRQYNILLRSYKKENRNVALSAIYEWLNEMHSELKQEYEDRFIYDSGMIDREENIDKFDKAKREIIARAMELDSSNGIKTINDNEKYKEIVQQIIRSLDFLNPFDKAKLTANILDVPTTSFLMARIDSILDIAKTMEDVSLRRNLEREIHKELQGTKNVRKNGRSVGKYDYRTNKIFEELRTLDRLSPEKANEMRLESSKFATAEDNGLSFKDKLVNKFLSYKAGGRTFADTELMKSLYDEITRIKLAGKTAKSEMELMDGLTEEQDIEELINIVNAKKDASIGTKIHLESIGNLESMLNAIFGKDIKERYATEILYAETQAQTFEYEQKKKLEEGIAKIYNLPKWNWDKQIIKYLGQEYKYPEIRRKYDEQGEIVKTRMIDRTLTKMDIIQAYIWSKNEILEKRLMNQFGEDTLYSMFEELSKEDEQLSQLLMDTAQSFYPLVNKAFIEKYGLDLPKVSCYFPSTPERGSEVDLYNEYSSKSLGNGFTKARANSETQAMDFHNPVATLYSHIDGVAKFCFMSNILDKSNIRFRDKDLKRAIVNKYGDGVFKVLENMLMSITYKSEGKINNAIEKIIDGMTSNWTVANIAGKLSIAFKQFISANNYALDMPSAEWFAGFTKSILDSSNTIKYMWNIPYVRARFGGSYSSEYLKQSIGNKLFTKTTKLKDALTIFLRLGDAGSLVFGGKPYIDYLINTKGMSEEQAIKQFIIQTNRYQQSSATTSLGMLQINASKQGWARPFTTYKNQQFQYLRGAIDSLYSCMNGDISKTECAKTIFHNIFLQPFIFNLATSGSLIRLAMTGDDDDLIADLRDSIFNLGTDAIAGLDIIWKAVIQKAFGEKNVRIATIPMWGDIQKEIFKLFKKDAELGDILHSAGYLFGNIATGIPINTVVSESKGIGTMLSDDVLKGLLMISGISEKTAGHMTGKEKK